MKNKFIIFTGPSAVGKHTIEKELFKDENLNIQLSISVTTRKPRVNEQNNVHYNFISEKDFEKKIKNNQFIEWNEHFSNKYGTLKSEIQSISNTNKIPFIEVDVVGAKKIIENFGEDNLLSIFVSPPSMKELKNRIILRNTETPKQIKQRMSRVEEEMKYIGLFDHIVVNDDFKKCVNKIKKIIKGNI